MSALRGTSLRILRLSALVLTIIWSSVPINVYALDACKSALVGPHIQAWPTKDAPELVEQLVTLDLATLKLSDSEISGRIEKSFLEKAQILAKGLKGGMSEGFKADLIRTLTLIRAQHFQSAARYIYEKNYKNNTSAILAEAIELPLFADPKNRTETDLQFLPGEATRAGRSILGAFFTVHFSFFRITRTRLMLKS